jgi:hypothetical protein
MQKSLFNNDLLKRMEKYKEKLNELKKETCENKI